MNSKLWMNKALSMCLVVAIIATYSMVVLASSERTAGELLIIGKNKSEAPLVKVNGEAAESGRSIFSSSTIATTETASAIISLGKLGKIELAPNTTLALTFDEKGINGDLLAGRVSVLNASDSVNIALPGGKMVKLNAGESAASSGQTQDDDNDTTSGGGGAYLLYALILGGAAAGIILATTSNNNNIQLSNGSTVISTAGR